MIEWIALACLIAAYVFAVVCVMNGKRRRYAETQKAKRQRMINDLVWGNTRWINGGSKQESPQEGIERLDREFP